MKCKVEGFVVILHRRVQKRKRKIYAGVVIICHIFKPRVPNCGFSVVPSLLDCLHRGLQTVMELYSEKVRLTAMYFLFFPVFFFFPQRSPSFEMLLRQMYCLQPGN